MLPVIEKIIDAHGGVELWNSLEALEADISVRGFLFTAKRIPVLNRVRIKALTRHPRFTFFDYPQSGKTLEFYGDEEVCITGENGRIESKRSNPRSAFHGLGKLISWDLLDFTYFAGYATWNYLVTPFLFLREGFRFEEMAPFRSTSGTWSRLRTTFPDDAPTHSKVQTLYFDEHLLLRRLDYTAEVIGHWAHAAHLCEEYQEFGGIKIPTSRRVYPMPFGNKPMPGPTLIAIDVHDVRPIVAPK